MPGNQQGKMDDGKGIGPKQGKRRGTKIGPRMWKR
jgi:hypothetical protein